MAQQTINIGSAANDGTGDPLRDAFDKANDNFTELYTGLGGAGVAASNDTTMAGNSTTVPPTQHAVIAYIAAQIAAVIASAPGALDTLKELADAINDDASFAATVTTALAGKLGIGGGTLTGALLVPDDAYDATTWNGSDEVPTKNAIRDKIEAIVAGIPGTYTDENAQDAVATMIGAGTNTGLSVTYNDAGNTESLALDPATGKTALGLLRLVAFFFTTTPTGSEVLGIYIAADAFTIPANLSGTEVSVGTDPAATFAIDVQKNGSTIATISIATSGAPTLSTSGGTSKSISAGDVIKFVAPATPDTTIANVAVNLKGTL